VLGKPSPPELLRLKSIFYADRWTLRHIILVLTALVCLSVIATIPRASSAVQGQLVLAAPSNGWDDDSVWRPSVVKVASGFMMWYSGESNSVGSIGLATSTDGLAWTPYAQNPVMTPGASDQWDRDSTIEEWVIYDGGQYKMWYSGQTWTQTNQLNTYQIGYATSLDGIHWTKYSGNPVFTPGPTGSWDDLWVYRPIVVATGSSYLMFYVGSSRNGGGRGLATSSDGIHWTRIGLINLPTSTWDAYRQRVTGVIKGDGGFLMAFDGWTGTDADPTDIGFATSTDGTNWTPYPENPVVTARSSTWDSGGISYPIVVAANDKYYVYFSAYPANNLNRNIGVAVLPASQYPIPEYASVQFVIAGAILTTAGYLALLKRQRGEL
jgi:predicted GH43/DUF377 family glycosyl hydrolase